MLFAIFVKAKNLFASILNSKNNGPVFLSKTIFRY